MQVIENKFEVIHNGHIDREFPYVIIKTMKIAAQRAERDFLMKTLEEFFKELDSSETLRNEFKRIKGIDALNAFLEANDCGFSVEDFSAFVNSNTEGELSDDEAKVASGGGRSPGEDEEEIRRYFEYKGWPYP